LTPAAKKEIYEIFKKYEEWTTSVEAYDQNDVVNYILNELKYVILKLRDLIL